ncbi:RNA polymerase sigma-70 factor [Halalkalibaculum sp. DA384]|uniref:RNA polymerase sigma-70 factor n=1 Tax=Halalkalibaculum sp. DA384 TaxID=3373606 RepID=UPI00375534E1
MDSVSDQQFSDWASRLRTSDETALDELFDQTFEIYVRYAWRFTKDKPSAVDIVQNSFIKLWNIRADLDPSQSLKTYIYRMVKNNALNYLRDHRQFSLSMEDIQLADPDSEIDVLPEESPLARHLEQWIEALPRRQKQAFELSRYEGLTHEEIAEVMDVAPRTVNNHIVAALNTLKGQYEQFREQRESRYEQ